MRTWLFSEQQYHPAWDRVDGPLRIRQPSRVIDPNVAAALTDRYFREWAVCDEVGIDIVVNEHHATLTCMSTSPLLSLAALARTTKNVRLLSLGTPITNRMDPLRIAEEIAMVDMMSHGRLEVGLVKGSDWELYNSNSNPVRMMDRFWEAHDFIVRALTSHDGPFAYDGEFYRYRNVNVFPRVLQQPHPPIWIPGSSAPSAKRIAELGYVAATFMSGFGAKAFFDAYRAAYAEAHGRPAPRDRLAYIALSVTADTEAEARARAERLRAWQYALYRVVPGTLNPPGYMSVADNVRYLRSGAATASGPVAIPTIDEMAQRGILFWGTPDMVVDQITRFHDTVGGFDHLLMQMGGQLTFEDTEDSLRLFAREVYPRLKKLTAEPVPMEVSGEVARRNAFR